MTKSIVSLSLALRATLDMHSLNNEGGEGNQIQTRMVNIIDHLGQMHNVNAISGDMLKHVLMEHFYRQARDQRLWILPPDQVRGHVGSGDYSPRSG